MNLLEQKKRLRAEILRCRERLSANQRQDMSVQITNLLHEIDEFGQAQRIFCFISYMSEVNTHKLIDSFIEQKLSLAVPKIIGKTEMLSVPLTDRSQLEPDKMGILTPKSLEIAKGPFDLVLTPGVGFTEKGDRLGYGRGYYDRWFANNEVKTKIGLCFEIQIVDELPTEATDVPLDMLVTEKRIIDLRNSKY